MKARKLFFHPIHEKCDGCAGVISSKGRLGYAKCRIYFYPSAWWKYGHRICPLATHLALKEETPLAAQRRRIGQQKQRRRR